MTAWLSVRVQSHLFALVAVVHMASTAPRLAGCRPVHNPAANRAVCAMARALRRCFGVVVCDQQAQCELAIFRDVFAHMKRCSSRGDMHAVAAQQYVPAPWSELTSQTSTARLSTRFTDSRGVRSSAKAPILGSSRVPVLAPWVTQRRVQCALHNGGGLARHVEGGVGEEREHEHKQAVPTSSQTPGRATPASSGPR